MPDLPPPLDLDPAQVAIFLDFDGTLAEIVEDPTKASCPPHVLSCLQNLYSASGGALAVVSGRAIAQLDDFLGPARLPLAGIHGLQRRSADGRLETPVIDKVAVAKLSAKASAFVDARKELLCEFKVGGVAVHYRKRPDLQFEVLRFGELMAQDHPSFRMIRGKMVVELAYGHHDKGGAIQAFLAEKPFVGRLPIFAGDDVTDEDGLRRVSDLGGIGIKIGPGASSAACRLAGPRQLWAWLLALEERWSSASRDSAPPFEQAAAG